MKKVYDTLSIIFILNPMDWQIFPYVDTEDFWLMDIPCKSYFIQLLMFRIQFLRAIQPEIILQAPSPEALDKLAHPEPLKCKNCNNDPFPLVCKSCHSEEWNNYSPPTDLEFLNQFKSDK